VHFRPVNLNPRTIRDVVFYAAVLILPGGSLIALAVWIYGRLSHRMRVADGPAADAGMAPQAVFVYAPGVAVAGTIELGAQATARSPHALEIV
jgi:hypothetical protein